MNSTMTYQPTVSPTAVLGNGPDPLLEQAKLATAAFNIPLDPKNIHEPSQEWDFANPPTEPAQFAKDLVDTMVANMGLGLAAPQVGLNYRVVAVRGNPMLVMFNPKIVSTSDGDLVMEEGCLSYRGIYIKVKRPKAIRVRFALANGQVNTERFEGLSARIIQHEIDHLDGITMLDRANKIHREQAERKLKQLKRRV